MSAARRLIWYDYGEGSEWGTRAMFVAVRCSWNDWKKWTAVDVCGGRCCWDKWKINSGNDGGRCLWGGDVVGITGRKIVDDGSSRTM